MACRVACETGGRYARSSSGSESLPSTTPAPLASRSSSSSLSKLPLPVVPSAAIEREEVPESLLGTTGGWGLLPLLVLDPRVQAGAASAAAGADEEDDELLEELPVLPPLELLLDPLAAGAASAAAGAEDELLEELPVLPLLELVLDPLAAGAAPAAAGADDELLEELPEEELPEEDAFGRGGMFKFQSDGVTAVFMQVGRFF